MKEEGVKRPQTTMRLVRRRPSRNRPYLVPFLRSPGLPRRRERRQQGEDEHEQVQEGAAHLETLKATKRNFFPPASL